MAMAESNSTAESDRGVTVDARAGLTRLSLSAFGKATPNATTPAAATNATAAVTNRLNDRSFENDSLP